MMRKTYITQPVPQPWPRPTVNCKTSSCSLAPLSLTKRCGLYSTITGNSGLIWSPMIPYSIQERVGMSWCPFSSFSGIPLVFFKIGKGLTVNSDAYYNELIHFAHKHRSHYDKAVKRCGPLLMHEKARKCMTNQTENYYYSLNFDVLRHPPYNPNMSTNTMCLFCSLQLFIAKKYLLTSRRLSPVLIIFSPKKCDPWMKYLAYYLLKLAKLVFLFLWYFFLMISGSTFLNSFRNRSN